MKPKRADPKRSKAASQPRRSEVRPTKAEPAADEKVPRFEICTEDGCPIEDVLDLITGRWKIEIIWWLQAGELRFGELRRRIPKVTQKVLTQQLRQLESQGLVHRELFAQVPPKVVYSLTARGQSLRPVLKSLFDWGRSQKGGAG